MNVVQRYDIQSFLDRVQRNSVLWMELNQILSILCWNVFFPLFIIKNLLSDKLIYLGPVVSIITFNFGLKALWFLYFIRFFVKNNSPVKAPIPIPSDLHLFDIVRSCWCSSDIVSSWSSLWNAFILKNRFLYKTTKWVGQLPSLSGDSKMIFF